MTVDLKGMSRKELLELRKDVDKAIVAAEARELKEARDAAERALAEYGFSFDDILNPGEAGKKGRATRAISGARYADPEDPSRTWTGKGRQPNWFKAAVERGIDPSAMEI